MLCFLENYSSNFANFADDTTPCECGHSFNEVINNIDLKMYKSMTEKIHFMLHLMIHLTVQSRGAPEGTFERAPNDTLSNLYKDAQKCAFELNLRVHLRLHLGCTCGCTCWYNHQSTNLYKLVHLFQYFCSLFHFNRTFHFLNLSLLVSEEISICSIAQVILTRKCWSFWTKKR